MHRRAVLAAGPALLFGAGGASAKSAPDPGPIVTAWAAANSFNGLVLLGRNGRPGYQRLFGLADVEAGKPLTIESRFGIASISKWLTAVTVLRLVDQGRLGLDDTIVSRLKDYRPDTGAKVRLRHLLANNSGVPNGFIAALKADKTGAPLGKTAAEATRLWGSGDLAFEPGTSFDYSLTNWIIVQAMIEAATGQAFPDVVRTLTLEPLGLRHTSPDDAGAAASYATIAPPVRRTEPRSLLTLAGGGYYSNASDLLRAAHLVFDTPFLKPGTRKALTTIEAPQSDYALGGRVNSLEIDGAKRPVAWETGRAIGYRSHLAHRLDTRSTVVILNNNDLGQPVLSKLAADLLIAGI